MRAIGAFDGANTFCACVRTHAWPIRDSHLEQHTDVARVLHANPRVSHANCMHVVRGLHACCTRTRYTLGLTGTVYHDLMPIHITQRT